MLVEEMADSRERQWELLHDYIVAYSRHRPVRKVAVVGNAPLPPSAERAAEIDSADLTIRVNSLMLDDPGYPPTLGTSCDVAIVSYSARITPWVFRDYRTRAYLVPQMGFVVHRSVNLVPPNWPPDLGSLPLPNAVVKKRLVDLLNPDHVPGSLIPTTGTTAVFLAHEMFPDADLVATGYSFVDDTGQREWAHQSGGSTKVNWQHDLALESALFRKWIADGSLRLLR